METAPRGHKVADDDDDDDDTRVVLHFDVDAFYVACEREINPALRHVPVAVSQYNPYGTLADTPAADVHARWVVQAVAGAEDATTTTTTTKATATTNIHPLPQQQQQTNTTDPQPPQDTNGSLIAVSYEARAAGVKRNQRGKEARAACPGLNIVQVPVKHGKADLTMYRTASKRVMERLRNSILGADDDDNAEDVIVEIASIDEVYMDVTQLANRLVAQVLAESASMTTTTTTTTLSTWQRILETAAPCTTIGGIEVLSEAAHAANNLGKDELRRGSHVQVLDSNTAQVDEGSRAWWHRPPCGFSAVQLRLVCGAFVAARARHVVQASGGVFTLSAGISTNKTLAKLASGLKKPNRQTLIYRDAVVLQKLFHPLPLGRIRGLGGKFGAVVADQLKIGTVGQLAEIPLPLLAQVVGKSAKFSFDISRGLCTDPVTPRSKPKSIECSKTFRGPLAIPVHDAAKLQKWIGELCSELQERLQQDKDEYNRNAATMKVSVQFHHQKSFLSKQMRAPRSLSAYPKTATEMMRSLIENTQKKLSGTEAKGLKISGMGVGGMQFVDVAEGSSSILSFATKGSASPLKSRASRASGTSHTRKRFVAEAKPSGVALWLRQSQQNSDPQPKRTKIGSAESSKGFVLKTASPMSTKESQATTLPSMGEVDLEVLKALPKDLQQQVLGDIRYQQSQIKGKEKKRSIQSFFVPRKGT